MTENYDLFIYSNIPLYLFVCYLFVCYLFICFTVLSVVYYQYSITFAIFLFLLSSMIGHSKHVVGDFEKWDDDEDGVITVEDVRTFWNVFLKLSLIRISPLVSVSWPTNVNRTKNVVENEISLQRIKQYSRSQFLSLDHFCYICTSIQLPPSLWTS